MGLNQKEALVFDPSHRRIWCHSSRADFLALGALPEQWYIPARVITLVGPRDLIMLPRHPAIQEFWQFICRTLAIREEQAIWTSGTHYLLDDDIREEMLQDLQAVMSDSLLVPYSVTDAFLSWAAHVPAQIFGDTPAFLTKLGHKGILHRRPAEPSSLLARHVSGIRVAKGFTCTTNNELLQAYQMLTSDGVVKLILKPLFGSAGDGIMFVTQRSEIEAYAFPFGPVVLEERLVIDRDSQDQDIAPSIQYNGQRVLGECLDQVLHGFEFAGNRGPSSAPLAFQAEMLEATTKLVGWMQPKGPGGFDFLSVEGKPVLVDINAGRFTGAHPAKLFRDSYAPGACFQTWKVKPETSVNDLWNHLNRLGVAFTPGSTSGIFPLCWLPGIWGMLIALGETPEQVHDLCPNGGRYPSL